MRGICETDENIDLDYILLRETLQDNKSEIVMQGMSGLTNIVYNLEKKQWEIISVVEKNQTTRCQFHQHFTRAFCANIFAPKNYNAKPN